MTERGCARFYWLCSARAHDGDYSSKPVPRPPSKLRRSPVEHRSQFSLRGAPGRRKSTVYTPPYLVGKCSRTAVQRLAWAALASFPLLRLSWYENSSDKKSRVLGSTRLVHDARSDASNSFDCRNQVYRHYVSLHHRPRQRQLSTSEVIPDAPFSAVLCQIFLGFDYTIRPSNGTHCTNGDGTSVSLLDGIARTEVGSGTCRHRHEDEHPKHLEK